MTEVTAVKAGQSGLYRMIWRWHFYAGIFCIPFMLTLALSGAIYLFKPQIDNLIDHEHMQLSVAGQRSTADQQITAALKAVPGSHFLNYRLPRHEHEAVVISVMAEKQRTLVYVNPYTLKVLKVVGYEQQLIRLVRTFHGELLAGTTGSIIIELAGCWAIVLIITGLYLWWPRSARGLAGILYPRWSNSGRAFWRDLHAVTGFWIAFFTLFLLISGLPWSLVWGTAFKELRKINQPQLTQSWSLSRQHEQKSDKQGMSHTFVLNQRVIDKAKALSFAPPVEISVAKHNPELLQVSSQHQNRPLRSTALLDRETAELQKLTTFADRSLLDRVVGIGIAAHEGHLFGWLNQLLGLLTAFGILVISYSGVVLWLKRRPSGSLGAPVASKSSRINKVVLALTVILAILLPLLAASILIVFMLERFVLKRLRPVSLWLGLRAA